MPVVTNVGSIYSTTGGVSPTFGAFNSTQRGLNLTILLTTDYTDPAPTLDTGLTNRTGWDLFGKMTFKGGLNTVWCFALTTPETNVAKTLDSNLGGAGCSGSGFSVLRIVGMQRFGAAAIRQFVAVDNQTAGSTPTIIWPMTPLANNPTLFFVGCSDAPPGLTAPANMTQVFNSGYLTPTTGGELWKRDSGGSPVIFGGEDPATDFGVFGIELDASPLGPSDHPVNIVGRGGMR